MPHDLPQLGRKIEVMWTLNSENDSGENDSGENESVENDSGENAYFLGEVVDVGECAFTVFYFLDCEWTIHQLEERPVWRYTPAWSGPSSTISISTSGDTGNSTSVISTSGGVSTPSPKSKHRNVTPSAPKKRRVAGISAGANTGTGVGMFSRGTVVGTVRRRTSVVTSDTSDTSADDNSTSANDNSTDDNSTRMTTDGISADVNGIRGDVNGISADVSGTATTPPPNHNRLPGPGPGAPFKRVRFADIAISLLAAAARHVDAAGASAAAAAAAAAAAGEMAGFAETARWCAGHALPACMPAAETK